MARSIAHFGDCSHQRRYSRRFLDKVVPEVYRKLLDSQPVNKWNNEIQTGVFNMTSMCIELIAVRLEQLVPVKIIPDILLKTLSLVSFVDF